MGDTKFTLQYPLFVLKWGEKLYASCHLSIAAPRPKPGKGLAIFTSESKAKQFARDTESAAEPREIDEKRLRDVLFSMIEAGRPEYVCFDPVIERTKHTSMFGQWFNALLFSAPRREDRIRVNRILKAEVIFKRYTEGQGWRWVYPLFAVYCWGRYATWRRDSATCEESERLPDKMAIIFTDSDLAGREIVHRDTMQGAIAVELANSDEFIAFIQALPPDVNGILFDPPPKDGSQIVHTVFRREDVMELLEKKL